MSMTGVWAQPTWITAPTPTPKPITVDITFQLSGISKVYYEAYNFNVPLSAWGGNPGTVKFEAINGTGGLCDHGVIDYLAGDVGSSKTFTVSNIAANSLVTIAIVAELTSGGPLTVIEYMQVYTLPCPPIKISTYFGNIGTCINISAQGLYSPTAIPFTESGILKGTQWNVTWGDGAIWSYISLFDGDIPAAQTHTYTIPVVNCNYAGTWAIQNPCGEFLNGSTVFVVHGRDQATDGDGVLGIVNNADGSAIIKVCEGTQTTLTLRDNSIWNCQSPVVPGGFTAAPNTDPRNIEWLYGRDPAGTIYNTITGDPVTIATLGNAPKASGRLSPIPTPTTLSKAITIPATCIAGQYFRVYLKNWNKCNWAAGAFISTYVDILVVSSPSLPIASDVTICYTGDPATPVLTAAHGAIAGDVLTWYANSNKTGVLGTGLTFSPNVTAVGTYTYYVADGQTTGNLCEGQAKAVTLTINDLPTITTGGTAGEVCFNTSSQNTTLAYTLTTFSPTSYSINWTGMANQGSTAFSFLPGGGTINNISIPASAAAGTYNGTMTIVNGNGCTSTHAVSVTINANPTLTITPAVPATCPSVGLALTATPAGGSGTYSSYLWTGVGAASLSSTTVANPTFTNATAGTYALTCTVTDSKGCTGSASKTVTVNTNPTLAITPATPATCAGVGLALTATPAGGSGTYSSYSWTGVGAASLSSTTAANPTFTNATAGTYALTCTVTDNKGCIGTDSKTVTVNVNPTLVITPAVPATCAGVGLALTATPAGGSGTYSSYSWTGVGAASLSSTTVANPTFTNASAGTYALTCTVTDNKGCIGTDSKTVTVNANPTLTITPAVPATCVGVGLALTATPLGGSGTYSSYLWTGVGAASLSSTTVANPTFTNATAGTYALTCTVTDNKGCIGTDSKTVTVNVNPTLVITPAVPATCAGVGLALTATPAGGSGTYSSYSWTGVGAASLSSTTVANPTFTNATAGTYALTCTVTDNKGCIGTDSKTVTVNANPTLVITPAVPATCAGVGLALTATPAGGSGTYSSYSWTGVGAASLSSTTVANPTFTNATAGTYALTCTVTDSKGCLGSASKTVTVNANPTLTITPAVPATCVGVGLALTATPLGGSGTYSSYLWTGVGAASLSSTTVANPTFTNATAGTYALTCTVTDNKGCIGTDSKTVTVNVNPTLVITPAVPATCAGVGLALTATPAGGSGTYSSYSWTGVGAASLSSTTVANPTFTNATAGTYALTCTVTDNKGCIGTDSKTVTVNANPTLVITPAVPATCAGVGLALTATPAGGSGTYSSYSWTGVGAASLSSTTVANPTFTNATAGTYALTCTVTDSKGCLGSASKTVTVNANPTLTITPAVPATCAGVGLALTATPAGGSGTYSSYLWTGVGAASLSSTTVANPTFTNATAGTYALTCTVTDNKGCIGTDSKTVTVNVNPTLVITPAVPATCAGVGLALTATPAGGSGTYSSYLWTGVGAASLSSTTVANPTFTNATAGTYALTCTVTDSKGCLGSAASSVNVIPLPTITTTGTASAVCFSGSAQTSNLIYSATTNGPDEYSIAYSGAAHTAGFTDVVNAALIASPIVLQVPAGAASATYTGNLTVTNSTTGCVSGITVISLTINPGKPGVPTISGVTPVCQSSSGVVYSVPLDATVSSYLWSFDAGLAVTLIPPLDQRTITVNFSLTSISGNVTVTASNGCGNNGASAPFGIIVNAAPTLVITPATPATCAGVGLALTATPAGGSGTYSSYLWTGVGAASLSSTTAANPTFTNATAGTYALTCTVTDNKGCIGTDSKTVTVNVNPTLVITPAVPATCAGVGLALTATPAGGSGTYSSYSWTGVGAASLSSTTVANPTFTNASAGTYALTCTVTDNKGCIGTDSKTVTVNANPTLTITPAVPATCVGVGLALTATPLGGSGTYSSYSWTGVGAASLSSTTVANPTFTNATAGTYALTCTVTDNKGCIGTDSKTVTVNVNPTLVITPAVPATCAGVGLALTATPAGGSGTYSSYSWTGVGAASLSSTTVANPTFTNATAGTYALTCTVTDNKGCIGTDSKTVTVNANPTLVITPAVPATCAGVGLALTATPAGGSGTYSSYSWTGVGAASLSSTTVANPTFTNATAGTYALTCTVTDNKGCIGTDSKTVTVNVNPTLVITPAVPATCAGVGLALTATPAGGSGTYSSYSWTGVGAASLSSTTVANPTFTNATAGTYALTCTVTDNKGCIGTDSKTVTVNANPTLVITPAVPATCAGVGLALTATPAGGSGTYSSYSWTGVGAASLSSTTVANPTFTNATAGTYALTCTVTDNKGCIGTDSKTVTVNANPTLVITPAVPATCAGVGLALTATPAGGSGTYSSYLWTGVGAASLSSTTVANPTFTNATAGTYALTCTVTDNKGCIGTDSKTVTVNANPTLVITPAVPATCAGVGLALTATPAGGSGTYSSYSWTGVGAASLSSTTVANPTFTNASAGTYALTCTVTDNKGCIGTDSKTVTVNANPTLTITPAVPATCVGVGLALTATPLGGSGTYSSYLWTGVGAASLSSTTVANPTFTNATAGTYALTCTVTDNKGCIGTDSKTVTVNANPTLVITPAVPATCAGVGLALTATPAGGSGTYSSYLWTGVGAASLSSTTVANPTFTNATAGTYALTCTVTDNKGCIGTDSKTVTVNVNPTLVITPAVPATCAGVGLALTATPAGGSGTYSSYLWTGVGAASLSSTTVANPTFTNATAGTYALTCTVTDNKGCIGTDSKTVTVNANPTLVITPAVPATCAGVGLALTATPAGGSGTYSSYSWTGVGAASLSSTTVANPTFTNASAGTYALTCTVTDNKGCIGTDSKTVTVNANPTLTITPAVPATCVGVGLALTATPLGGSGTYSSYLWTGVGAASLSSTTVANPTFTNATAGTYALTCTVTDNKGCIGTDSKTVTVNVNPTLVITPAVPATCAGVGLALTATPAGGSGTYSSYSWTGVGAASLSSTTVANPTFTNATAGTYALTCTVTDNKGCIGTDSKTVTVNANPTLVITPAVPATCAGVGLALTATPAGGSGTYSSYSWTGVGAASLSSTTVANPTFTNAAAGTYALTCTVTDNKGCIGTDSKTVTVNANPTLVITPAVPATCAGVGLALTATPAGGSGTYSSYSWTGAGAASLSSTTVANPTFTNATAGTYALTCTVTDNKGCIGTDSKTITVNINPTATIAPAVPATCEGVNLNLTATPAGGSGTFTTHLWTGVGAASLSSTSIANPVFNNGAAGSYALNYKVTDDKGCIATTSTAVTVNHNPTIASTGTVTPVCSNPLVQTTSLPYLGTGYSPISYSIDWVTLADQGNTANAFNVGAGSVTGIIIPAGTVAGTYTGTMTITTASGCTATQPVSVIVNPLPVTTIPPLQDAIICVGTANKAYQATDHSGSTWYTWSVPGNLTKAFDANLYFILINATSAGSGNIQVYETDKTTGCVGLPQPINVTVSPAIPAVPVSSPVNLCKDASATFSVPDNTATGSTYSWTLPLGAFITGDASSYSVLVTFPIAPVSGNVSVFETNGSCSQFHPGAPVNVYALPAPTINGNSTACINSTGNVYTTEAGMSNYTWTVSGGTFVPGATPDIIIVDWTAAGNQTITVTYKNANGCFPTTPTSKAVTVYPLPSVTTANTATICSGSGPGIALAATIPSTFTWTIGTISGSITGAGNGSGNMINQILTNPSNSVTGSVEYLVVPTSVTGSCQGPSYTITVTVNPKPGVTNTPISICSGTSTSLALTASLPSNFIWTIGTVTGSIIGTSPGSGGTINQVLTNLSSTTAGSVQYMVTPTSTGDLCTGSAYSVVVTVNPIPQLSSSLTPPSICSGSVFNYTAISTVSGSAYTWSRAAVGGISEVATNGVVAGISETLTNTTTSPINVTYVYTITASGCVNTQNVVVVVNPIPVLSSTLTPTAICSGSTFGYTATSLTAGTTYSWSRSTLAGITEAGTTGAAAAVSETLTNTTTAPISVTYVYTITANGCVNTQNVVLVVNPKPVLNSTLTPTGICSGSTFGYTATSLTAGTTFSWSRATIAGITEAGTTGLVAAVSETLTNTTTAPINVTYVYTITANGCVNTQNVVVTVNPIPKLSSTLTPPAICSGSTFGYTATSATTGATFGWTRAAVGGITEASSFGSGNVSEVLTNTTTAPINVIYLYTTTANGCSNAPENVTVTVNPKPVLDSPLSPAGICSGSTFNYTATSLTGGATFSWSRATIIGIAQPGTTGVVAAVSETLTNTTTAPINVTYVYTITASGCVNTQNVVVAVNPIPVLNSSLTPPAICSGLTFTYTGTSLTPGATFAWSRATIAGITEAGTTGVVAAVSETLTNTTTAPINVTYIYTITANGCINTQNVVVTVNPIPVLNSTLTPADICSGSAFNYTATSSTVGATFSWSRATLADITQPGTTGVGATVSEVLTNTSTAPVSVTYVYTITANGCVNTNSVVVIVNPKPVLNSTLTPPAICSGTTFAYTATSATGGSVFAWSRAAVAGITEATTSGAGNVSETLTNTTAASINVTYIYVTTANGCSGPPQNVVVVVNPTPVLSSTLTPAGICSGSTFTYTATCATSGATYTWSRAAVGGISEVATNGVVAGISETLTNITTSPINVTYVYTITASGCVNTQNVVVVVNPIPVLSSTLTPAAICSGTTFSYTATSLTAGTTYSWSRSTLAGITEAGTTGAAAAVSETLTNTTTAPISVTYVYTITANGCVNTQNVVLVVNPKPVLNSTLTPTGICSGSTFGYTATSLTAGTTFSWSRATIAGITEAGTTGLVAAVSETLTNTTTAPINVTYVYTITANGCVNTQNVVVTVNPIPKLSSTLTPPAICSGSTFGYTATSATTGATFGWTRAAVGGITEASSFGSGNVSEVLTNTTTAPINVIYLYTTTANGCSNAPENVTVTVNPKPVLDSPLSPAGICSGSTFNYTATSLTGGATFSWSRATIIGIAQPGTTGVVAAVSETLTNTTTAPINVTYVYTITASGCVNTQNVVVAVNPIPVLNSSLTPPAICSGLTFTYTGTSLTPGATFAWSRATIAGITEAGTTGVVAAVSETLTNTTTAPINVTYIYTITANGCINTQNVVVTVNPIPVLNSTLTPADICSGSAFNYTATSSTVGATFSWSRATLADITQPGTTGVGATVSEVLTNTSTAPVSVTYVYTITANGCVNTNSVVVIVNPKPVLNSTLTPPAICSGTTFAYTATSATGGSVFAWSRAAVAGITEATTSGAGNVSETLTNTTAASINVTYIYVTTANGCSGPPQNVVVVVNPTPVLSSTLTPAGICSGSTFTYTATCATSGATYTWSRAAVGGISEVATNGVVAGISETLTNITTSPINVTYVYTITASGCVNTQNVVVVVNPIPVLSSTLTPAAICSGSTFGYTATSLTAGTTYSWSRSTLAGITEAGTTGAAAAVSETLTNTTTAPISVTYVYTITANGCVNTQNVVLVVNPKPVLNSTLTPTGICSGSTFGYTATSLTAGTTFSWSRATIAGITEAGTTGLVAAVSETLTNTTTAPINVTYVYTFTANGCVNTQNVVVTVNPLGQVNNIANQVVCTGATSSMITFTTSNTGGTTSYDWLNDSPGIGLPASGNTSVPAFTAVNTGSVPVVATITVTPHFTNGSVTCDGPDKTFTITVNPTPNVTTASPTTICSASTTNISLTSNVIGATFNWTIAGVTGSVSGASASSGAVIAQILVNPGTSAGQVTYRVTPTASSCSGLPVDIIVTVNPTPNVTSAGLTTICSATATNILLSSNVSGATFSWTIGTVSGSISGQSATSGPTIAQALTNAGTTPGSVTYIVTPIANSCPGNPVNIVVTVNPTPDVTTASPAAICSGTATNIALTGSVTGTTYSWTIGSVSGSVSGATASNGTTIAQTLYNTGLTPGTVTYIVTPTANSCSGPSTNIVVPVNPSTGAVNFTTGAIEVCQDAPNETYTATATNSTSVVYSVSPAAAGSINTTTGIMDWDFAYYGNATITATAAGLCGTTVGTVTVRVKRLPSIQTNPVASVTCEFGTVNFDVTANGSDLIYKWLVDPNTGTFVDATGGVYYGQASSSLRIWSADRSMNNYKYKVVVSGCLPDVESSSALLTVNTAPELTVHPKDTTACLGTNTVMKAASVGTGITWTWYVNKGSGGFVPVVADTHFSFATSVSSDTTKTSLTISDALSSYNNWIFRATATGTCGAAVNSNFGRLSVTNPPVVTLQPVLKVICENNNTTFVGNGGGYTSLQWQVSSNNGTTYTNVNDDAVVYVGSVSNQLSILNAPVTLNNNLYRLELTGTCTKVYTNGVKLTVNPNPVVNFAAINPVAACGGVPITINGNPTGGTAPYTHRWTGDVGPLSNYTTQSPTFNSQIAGTYNLNYKVTDSKNCSANGDVAVIVDSPSADFTQDANIGCTPLTVKFIKDMTGITKFWWDFNDGSPKDSVNTNPTHVFTNSNASSIEYRNVSLTVRSAGGCLKSFTSLITVYPAIVASFTASTTTVCSGNPIVFTAISGASKYFWEYGDGSSGYSTNVTSHLYTNFTTAPVVNHVKLTTTSFYNCVDEKTIDITVMPVPIAQFSAQPPTQIYSASGNPVAFTNETNAGTWNFLWKFGDGATSTAQNPSHTYTALGDFSVVLKVNNANCSDSIKHIVKVTPQAPVANFDSIPSTCQPLMVTVNNTSLHTETPGTTYRWDFGDGYISTAKNPSHTYFDAGPFPIELTVTGPGGVSVKSQVVNSYPTPKANFTVSPTFVFVNDEKVRGFNQSTGADSYVWEWGDGDTSKVAEPFHKYMVSGVYDITLWAASSNGCRDKFVLSPGVTVEPSGEIRFATVFAPNLDGPVDGIPTPATMDQFFYPPMQEKVSSYKLQIFNRLGVLIFESRDVNIPWNGYYKGKLCPQGVYIWYVEGKYSNGEPFKKVGDVTLLH